MSQQELLTRVAAALDAAGLEWVITGSLASSLQGEPRSTHDIDLIIAVSAKDVEALVRLFPANQYYLDEASVREAVESGEMFNLIDHRTGDKVDFWMLTEEPFDQSRFKRRRREPLLGLSVPVTTPEDTILQKLRWMKLSGGSEKQFRDALGVYEVQFEHLDTHYLVEWSARLEVDDALERLREEAAPL